MQLKKTVLHVGCAMAQVPLLWFPECDWKELRIDIDSVCQPDIVASAISMPQVASGSCAAVFCRHMLEHLYYHEVSKALGEFYRVLAPGGTVHLFVPDLLVFAKEIVEHGLQSESYVSECGPITPLDSIYGHSGWIAKGRITMAHHTGFTADTLAAKLKEAGFPEGRGYGKDREIYMQATKGGL